MGKRFETMEALFRDPARHTKGTCARDQYGVGGVACDSAEAIQWCFIGGFQHVYGVPYLISSERESIWEKINRYVWRKYGLSMAELNDLPTTKPEDIHQICKELGI